MVSNIKYLSIHFLFNNVISPGFQFILWMLLLIAFWPIGELAFLRKVYGKPRALFPVFISWKENDGSIQYRVTHVHQLHEIMKKHTNYSLLVPSNYKQKIGELAGNITISVVPIEEGRQKIKLVSYNHKDSCNIGWYEATDRDFYPKMQLNYGTVFIIIPAFIAGFLALATLGLLRRLYQRVRQRRILRFE